MPFGKARTFIVAAVGAAVIVAAYLVIGGPPPPAGQQRTESAAECGLDRPVVLGELDWDSARFHAHVAGFILEHGYGCEVERVPGSTVPLIAGMARGDIDVIMEIWRNNVPEVWERAAARGHVELLSVNFPDAVQGWYVPRYLIEGDPERGLPARAPDLRSVRDLARHWRLFRDPEVPDKGRFYNCLPGWVCERVNRLKLEAYGLVDHYTNFRPGSGPALAAAIASAYERGAPILAYYWGPSWVLGRYDLVRLDEPPFDQAAWERLLAAEDGHGLRATAYPTVAVYIGVNTTFKAAAPALTRFLRRYRTDNATISAGLAFMRGGEDRTVRDAAVHFLERRGTVWRDWVPETVARRIRDALDAERR